MTMLRKLLVSLLLFVLPVGVALAAEKQYILTVANSAATPAPAYTFRFTNDGNSSFNALTLSLPSGWTIAAGGGASASRGVVTVNGARNVVSVENINLPTGAGQFMTVTVTGVAGTATCGNQSGAWTAQPWTGSAVGSGQKFNPKPGSIYPVSTTTPSYCATITATAGTGGSISPSGTVQVLLGANQAFTMTPTTSASGNYRIADVKVDGVSVGPVASYTFNSVQTTHTIDATFAKNQLTVTPPTTVYVGTAFYVSVAFDGPSPSSVTLSWTCTGAASGSQTIAAPPTLTSPLTFSVTLDKAGACTFKATAPDYFEGTFATKVDVYSGTLGCTFPANKQGDLNPQALVTYVKKSDQGKWGLIRGNNKDATLCAVVPYTFEVDVLSTPQQSKFIVPNSPQKVAVKYTVVWGRFDVVGDASNIWAAKRPKLSWGIAAPVNATNDFVPALPCVLDPDNPDLVGTYPNGFTSVPTADLDKLLPVIPDLPPFSNVYNATTAPNNIKGNPNYPQYQPGQKAKMCIAQQGWTATGSDASDPLDVSVEPSTVQIWTSVIDQGDGYMNLE